MLLSTILMLLFIIVCIFGGTIALVYISVKRASDKQANEPNNV